jgi:vacuolar-type H+-ATPase subunit H
VREHHISASIYPSINRFKEGCLEMAQAKKPQKKNEPSGPMSPAQARESGDQVAGQAREMGEQAGEQMRQFLEQARALNEQILESATKFGEDAVQRYVSWLQTIAEEQRKLASSPQVSEIDWFASMLKAQADLTQQFAKMVGSTSFGRQSQS